MNPPFKLYKFEVTAVETALDDDGDTTFVYVLKLIENNAKSDKLIAAVLSDQTIKIYDSQTLKLKYDLNEKFTSQIAGAVFSSLVPSHIIIATTDGWIGTWDTIMGCNGSLIAIGCEDGSISFYDTTTAKLLGKYIESHIERVSSIVFHAQFPTLIATCSEDGLVNIFDISIEKEEDALRCTVHCECALTTVGWCGSSNDLHIYALTVNHGIDVWDVRDGTRLVHVPSLREFLSVNFSGLYSDFAIDCIYMKEVLHLFIGDNRGTVHILQVKPSGFELISSIGSGHLEGVRSIAWNNYGFYTGGEDSRLCMWVSDVIKMEDDVDESSSVAESDISSGGKIKRTKVRARMF